MLPEHIILIFADISFYKGLNTWFCAHVIWRGVRSGERKVKPEDVMIEAKVFILKPHWSLNGVRDVEARAAEKAVEYFVTDVQPRLDSTEYASGIFLNFDNRTVTEGIEDTLRGTNKKYYGPYGRIAKMLKDKKIRDKSHKTSCVHVKWDFNGVSRSLACWALNDESGMSCGRNDGGEKKLVRQENKFSPEDIANMCEVTFIKWAFNDFGWCRPWYRWRSRSGRGKKRGRWWRWRSLSSWFVFGFEHFFYFWILWFVGTFWWRLDCEFALWMMFSFWFSYLWWDVSMFF